MAMPGARCVIGFPSETFVALCFYIDNWRWAGVPFYIRSSKCLPVTATEVFVSLKNPPHSVFGDGAYRHPNYFRFRLNPDFVISVGARIKAGGEDMVGDEVELVAHEDSADHRLLPYARLLGDALQGDLTLFNRQDAVYFERLIPKTGATMEAGVAGALDDAGVWFKETMASADSVVFRLRTKSRDQRCMTW